MSVDIDWTDAILVINGDINMNRACIRTTLSLPADLLAEADHLIRSGGARSRNELVAQALTRELQARERAAIDAAFAGMASDEAGQAETATISREFQLSDWEAWQQRNEPQ